MNTAKSLSLLFFILFTALLHTAAACGAEVNHEKELQILYSANQIGELVPCG